MIAIILIAIGAVFGFAYGVVSYALPFVSDMDVFTSTGIGFGLSAGASLVLIAVRLVLAAGHLVFACLLLVAPVRGWPVALITDPLGHKARIRQRARLDAIYPPITSEGRPYVET